MFRRQRVPKVVGGRKPTPSPSQDYNCFRCHKSPQGPPIVALPTELPIGYKVTFG